MEEAMPNEPKPATVIEQAFNRAVAEHQAGRLEAARKIYRTVLQVEPTHAVANHNLGVIAVQLSQPAEALPCFLAALEADPTQAQYWLSYIDALCQAGQDDDARQVLALARQQGLQGDEVDALAHRLAGSLPVADAGRESPWPDTDPVSVAGHAPAPGEIDDLLSLFARGRLGEAANRARIMTRAFPGHWLGWKMLGVVLQRMGNNAEALPAMRRAVELTPGDAEARVNLGIVFKELGRLEESVASYRQALNLNPQLALAHGNLGASLHELGRLDEAEASYRQALKIEPKYAKAHGNLGAILHDLNRLDEAEASFRRALELESENVEALCNLGNVLKDLGRYADSEATIRKALEVAPESVKAMSSLAATLAAMNRMTEAESYALRVVELDPNSADAHRKLGDIKYKQGAMGESQSSYRRALELKPDDFHANCNLGVTLSDTGFPEQAEAWLRKALEVLPGSAEAHNILGVVLLELERPDEAEAQLRQALAIAPNAVGMHGNLGTILCHLGRLEEAVASYRRALAIDPTNDHARSNMLHCLSLIADIDAPRLFEEHCRFGELCEAPLREHWPQFTATRDPERALRVGFVSGDLRNHVVASYVEPVLAALVRHERLSLHAYSNSAVEDATTKRLMQYFAQWHTVHKVPDEALAQMIAADGVDILIDLSGHTAKNRLMVFARKPAPVQVSWMGYPGTTGLQAMDYYLADRLFLPSGRFDDHFTEKIVRLPANAPFLPSGDAPPVNLLPALGSGHLTFGSFNRLNKLGAPVIALWARILRALPESRMLLGAMRDADESRIVADWFAAEGVSRDRLEFHLRCDMERYLALHHRVDLCLDTFPYNGATTTLHALWMGVPTINLAGHMAAGQTGAAILGHLGLDDFVAGDADAYVAMGLSWAGRLPELARVRAGLRERFAASAPGQPELIAAALDGALRVMWRRWCAGLPAESFEIRREDLQGNARGTVK